jgi:uncharacterized protein YjbI with pentapeptide repeats
LASDFFVVIWSRLRVNWFVGGKIINCTKWRKRETANRRLCHVSQLCPGPVLFFVISIIATFSLMSNLSYAFSQADLDKLLATKRCEWCDLRNADLSGAQLSGATISN